MGHKKVDKNSHNVEIEEPTKGSVKQKRYSVFPSIHIKMWQH